MTITVNISSAVGSECRISDFLDSITAYTSISATLITASTDEEVAGKDISLEIVGSGFSFDSEGNVTGGTVSEIRIYADLPPVTLVSTATGLAVDASDLLNGNLATIESLIYGSDSFIYTGDVGADKFTSGDKDDFLIGGAGADTLDGGAGIDTISYEDSGSAVTVNLATKVNKFGDAEGDNLTNIENAVGSAGDDTLTGDGNANTFTGGKGGDAIDGGGGIDTASYAGSAAAVSINLTTDSASGGDAEGDTLANIENLVGSDFADTLIGDGNANMLRGGKGADTLDGGAGNDTVSYAGATVGVSLTLGAGGAVATGAGTGSDALGDKVSNVENIEGGEGVDALTGNELANVLTGNGGNDTLKGNAGDDILMGGEGADTLDGGLGLDTASYANANAGVAVNLGGTTGAGSAGSAAGDKLTAIENLIGTQHVDTLTGGTGNNVIEGGAGGDKLTGNGGNDTLSYAGSEDGVTVTLVAGNKATVSGGDAAGDDATGFANLIGSTEIDTLTGDTSDNIIEGGAGADVLDGDAHGAKGDTLSYAGSNAGVDVNLATNAVSGGHATGDTVSNFENVLGSALDDMITGDGSVNTLTGGAGNDVLKGGLGADTIDGGAGLGDWVSFEDATTGITLTLGAAGALATVSGGDVGADKVSNVENIRGGAGADSLTGNALDNIIEGDLSDLLLDGGTGIDTISFAKSGSLVVVNLANETATIKGFEIVVGSAFADDITGTTGDNIIEGGAGGDTLAGDANTVKGDTLSYAADTKGVTVVLKTGLAADLSANVGALNDADGDSAIGFENIIGGKGADTLTGDTGANIIEGGAGDDTITGGGGLDTLKGDAGDDKINGGTAAETIDGGAGVDTVDYSSDTVGFGITLGKDGALATATGGVGGLATGDKLTTVENVTGGGGNDTITGNNLANVLKGGDGDDTIQGGAGADTLQGGGQGAGGDTLSYSLSTAGVTVYLGLESGGGDAEGDSATGFENLTGSAFNDTLIGNAGVNKIDGGAGDDVIQGRDGADVLIGGANGTKGDTLSYADDAAGVDITLSAGNATIGAGGGGNHAIGDTASGFENLRGGSGADTLTGDTLANVIEGGAGGDTLDGGAGTALDTLSYASDTTGVNVDIGTNTALGDPGSHADGDSISNFENLIGGSGNDQLTGGAGVNTIAGGAGNDVIDGGTGTSADTLDGGAGTDTVTYAASAAGVTVALGAPGVVTTGAGVGSSALGDKISNFENIIGSGFVDTLTGNALANELTGDGGGDKLDGGAGADKLTGGLGDDTYVVDNASDQVIEAGGEGKDTVQSSASFTLASGQEIEALILTGTAAINAKGNEFDNTITGNSGANIIEGGAGADTIDGKGGLDTLSYVSSASGVTANLATKAFSGGDAQGDVVNSTFANLFGSGNADTLTGDAADNLIEGGAGTDTLAGGANTTKGDTLSYASDTLGVTVVLKAGLAADLSANAGTGNDAEGDSAIGFENIIGGKGSDALTGDTGANAISGGDGNDVISGGVGIDTLKGEAGDDTIAGGAGADILDGGAGIDTVDYSTSTAAVTVSLNTATSTGAGATGSDSVGDKITGFENIVGSSFNDILQGGLGANKLVGGDGNDQLDGATGADILIGGLGGDVYIVDNIGDVVVESAFEGIDRVKASVSYVLASGSEIEILELTGTGAINATGNDIDNTLIGNTGANVLMGGLGSDYLDGGAGIDIASYAGETEGVTVSLLTGSGSGGVAQGDILINIENLTGGLSIDDLTGNAAVNVLMGDDGNDKLEGGAGADTLDGGAGIDTARYAASAAGVTVNLGLGVAKQVGTGDAVGDILKSIENVEGSQYDDVLTGDDNANVLTGGDGNDTLTGGKGADTLQGGLGNDTYVLKAASGDASDIIDETGGGGTDTVQADLTFTITNGSGIENLTLTGGTAAIDGTGNDQDNVITGNDGGNTLDGGKGDDRLAGGKGNDTLKGGDGKDTFVIGAGSGIDIVKDFAIGQDKIDLFALAVFASIASILAAAQQDGDDTKITLSPGNELILEDVNVLTLTESDFLFNDGKMAQAPTDIQLAGASVFENASSGSTVGTFTATDPEGGTFTFELLDSAFGRFGLSGNKLIVNGGLDYDKFQTHSITVRVKDSTGLTYDEKFTIDVKDAGPIYGTAASDTITGSPRGEIFFGLDGNDYFAGRGGKDVYYGGPGSDIVSYFEDGTEGITVYLDKASWGLNTGSAANDEFYDIESIGGTKFNDHLIGDAQNNFLRGNGGADQLDGGAGQDWADYRSSTGPITVDLAGIVDNTAEAQGDTYTSIERVRGGLGNDTLYGDDEDFTADGASVPGNVLDGYIGADKLDGRGGGTDFASYMSASAAVKADLTVGADSAKSLTLNTGDAKGDTYFNLEGLWGSDFNDTLTGDTSDNILVGWKGGDLLKGGGGNDTAAYYANSIFGTNGVTASLSNSALNTGDAAGDTYDSIENLFGTPFADTLIGDVGDNKLSGDRGNDILIGLGGADTLDGGGGTDIASYAEGTAGLKISLADPGQNTALSNADGDTYIGIEGLRGTKLDDELIGDAANNILIGGEGEDKLDGGAGNDFADYRFAASGLTASLTNSLINTGEAKGDTYTSIERLRGSAFDDTLIGDTGGNNLEGGGGADVLDGGAGFDMAQYSLSSTGLTVSLGDPSKNTGDAKGDVFISIEGLWGSNFADYLEGSAASNELLNGGAGADVLDGGAGGNDRAAYFSSSVAMTIDLADSSKSTGDGFGDIYKGIEGLVGGDLGDTLKGDANANQLEGRLGDDILMGRGGGDVLIGDLATGVQGIDLASYAEDTAGIVVSLETPGSNTGEAAGDTYTRMEGIIGGSGDDTLTGNSGNNVLIGGEGADTLDGGSGGSGGTDTADYRFATSGVSASLSDSIVSNSGEALGDVYLWIEYLTGSAFDDTLEGNGSANRLDGGSGGNDTVSFANASGAVTASLANNNAGATGFAAGDVYVSIENLTGSTQGDTLTGDDNANVLHGGAGTGADALDGGKGDDTLIGGDGNDLITGGDGTDTVSYEDATGGVTVSLDASNIGVGQVTGGAGTDTLTDQFENLTGSAHVDTLTGSAGDNVIDGGASADTIDGGAGDDVLIGGAGGDTLTGGTDTGAGDFASYETALTGLVAGLDGAVLTSAGLTVSGDAVGDTYSGIENLRGGAFNDTLLGDADNNVLQGREGNDILGGVGGINSIDTLDGGDGNDTASYKNDTAGLKVDLRDPSGTSNTGGAANDIFISIENVVTGSGNDTLIGDIANNVLTGGAGADALDGKDGYDTASYGTATGGVKAFLDSKVGTNTGDAAGDTYTSIENLSGSAFDDTLIGDASNNRIFGQGGDDILGSRGGADVLDGGDGKDDGAAGYQDDNDGTDVVSFSAASVGANVNLADSSLNNGSAKDLILFSIEGVIGSAFDDRVTGNASNNIVYGSAGKDTFIGGSGDESDIDTMSYAKSTSAVTASLWGTQVLNGKTYGNTGGDAAGDFLGWVEILIGTDLVNFGDTLIGAGPNSKVFGGLGNDFIGLTGGGGIGIGGAGADTFEGSFAINIVSYETSTIGLTIDLTNTANNTGDAAGDKYSSIESIIGSDHNDIIVGAGPGGVSIPSTISLDGGKGDDTITSNDWATVLIGGAGADTLNGHKIADINNVGEFLAQASVASYETAKAGVEVNLAAPGSNTGDAAGDTYTFIAAVWGSAYDDKLVSGFIDHNNDTFQEAVELRGGGGDDKLYGDAAWFDSLDGGAGADSLDGGLGGHDVAAYGTAKEGVKVYLDVSGTNTGDAAGDTYTGIEDVRGSWFNDTLSGDGNNNFFWGNGGSDEIFGLAGNDVVHTGDGTEIFTGGAGEDAMYYEDEAMFGDIWEDFTSGTDKFIFNYSSFDNTSQIAGLAGGAGAAAGGIWVGLNELAADYFATGTADKSGHGQFVFDTSGSSNILYWDEDGTGSKAKQVVADIGSANMTASDIILGFQV